MSIIKRLPIAIQAKIQGDQFGAAYCVITGIKRGYNSAKMLSSEKRRAQRYVNRAIALEVDMVEVAWARPCDCEDWANSDLVGAIHALTQSRINRLAYAGRVLP